MLVSLSRLAALPETEQGQARVHVTKKLAGKPDKAAS